VLGLLRATPEFKNYDPFVHSHAFCLSGSGHSMRLIIILSCLHCSATKEVQESCFLRDALI
jgi:hypothetical protein